MFDLPEIEIDELTGKPRYVQLQQNSLVYNPLNRKLLYTKAEVDAKIQSSGGGSGVQSIVAGTNVTVDSSDPAHPIISASGGSGSGIVRVVSKVSSNTNAGSAASTDYVYLVSGTTVITLPTATSNTNRYTIANVGGGSVSLVTTSSQTINGSLSVVLPPSTSLDLISDNTNWIVI